ncbi:hypothetical protein SISSUDRAFT_227766 [Sistotremastrum suecicum HHB10207 ss-3]|uniref:Uncharacterized protein n=1 Tax=Sistotremastrum suecicum HHB10207 ss-3 TaxID=1314776 RepID=A0A166A1F2_9AGAM|nr:hypothetical protein SISSUDRAFT_227766 [Sistotremastrum suecicum HHB10207 ss-3]
MSLFHSGLGKINMLYSFMRTTVIHVVTNFLSLNLMTMLITGHQPIVSQRTRCFFLPVFRERSKLDVRRLGPHSALSPLPLAPQPGRSFLGSILCLPPGYQCI